MNLQQLLNSRRAGMLAQGLSRSLPPGLGYWLADLIADRIASRRHLPMVQSVRANQWVVHQGELSTEQLDGITREVIRQVARSFYLFFHYSGDERALDEFIAISPTIEDLIARSISRSQGALVCGLHMSNFDLAYQAIANKGLHAIGLTMPQATEAIEWQHQLRRRVGLEILPATLSNLRQVIHRLEAGEIAVTGVDRPVDDTKCRPRFFGRPAQVPVHYVQLALRAKVPLIIMAAIMRDDGCCHILSSDYIELQSYPDRETELIANAERVLDIAASFIRQAPNQWSIFQPVWPEVLSEVPRPAVL